jgi:hypothetical protein
MGGHGDVLFFAFGISETKVDKFDLIFFDEGEYLCGLHVGSSGNEYKKAARNQARRQLNLQVQVLCQNGASYNNPLLKEK